jgi:hypothetical protein
MLDRSPSMDALTKAAGELYRTLLDPEGGDNGDGAAVSKRAGIEVLVGLLVSLPYEDLCRYLSIPAPAIGRPLPRHVN